MWNSNLLFGKDLIPSTGLVMRNIRDLAKFDINSQIDIYVQSTTSVSPEDNIVFLRIFSTFKKIEELGFGISDGIKPRIQRADLPDDALQS